MPYDVIKLDKLKKFHSICLELLIRLSLKILAWYGWYCWIHRDINSACGILLSPEPAVDLALHMHAVYISQLIRYARCCTYYEDFAYRHKLLVDRLLSQGYKANRLRNSFNKFFGRYPDLFRKYQMSVSEMVNDSFPV